MTDLGVGRGEFYEINMEILWAKIQEILAISRFYDFF
jgi:hypothetical protein